jgi:predicted DNA-binding transcriptional regulator AlpA
VSENPPLRDLLREAEAARRLGTSMRTLQKWRCNGKGPRFVRLSRAVRYDPADLDAFVAIGRRTSTSDPGTGLVGRGAAR